MTINHHSNWNYRRAASASIWGMLVVLILLSAAGCGTPAKESDGGDKVKVAVSIVPQATFVQEVGGDLVEVVTMIPPGGNPENYAPTPQQMMQFSDADVYFAIGVPTEEVNLLPQLARLKSAIRVVDLVALVDQKYQPVTFPSGARDPHMWLSPRRVQEIVRITAVELAQIDPGHREIYQTNAQRYIERLGELDQEISTTLDGLSQRTFIVYHPAFGYFADDYGLTMVALEEEGKEATALDLEKLIDLARSQGIKVVFYQAEIDSKQSRTLAAEIGGQAEMIAPLDPDYIGNLEKTALTFKRIMQ